MSQPEYRIPEDPDIQTQPIDQFARPTQPVNAAGWQPEPAGRSSRWPVYLAAFLVVLLGGGGLFVSGFSLGRLSGATPGTSETRQDLFRPFWDAYNDISANYVGEYDQRELVEGAIKGVFQALDDPFSSYMTEQEYRDSLTGLSGEFEGIGATLTTRDAQDEACTTISADCRLVIVSVMRNSPALRAGLQAEDVVLEVDGRSTLDSTIDLVIPQIRGPKGTSVTLTIDRDGQTQQISIVRDVIQSEDVISELLADGRVGYVKVIGFRSGTARDLKEQLSALVEDPGVEALILDLRDDPGGYVDAARRIASEFVGEGPLFWEQGANREPVAQDPIEGGVATDPSMPMIVLVNGGTASASEIVAGALQGSGRARLVGEKTYGKGTIQEWKELEGAGGYRLSVRKWLTPDQTWIHGEGITPDVVVTPPADPQPGTDFVRERAVELLLDELEGSAQPALAA